MRLKYNKILGLIVLSTVFIFGFAGYFLQKEIINAYQTRESLIIKDRKGREIFIKNNINGYRARYLSEIPPRFKELLVKKEDKFFYFHFGFNPASMFQAALGRFGIGNRKASSAISQQLSKILLGNEFERNLKNKIVETFYALALETFQGKEEILIMYVNSIYFGSQIQGLAEASMFYFGLSPDLLSDGQILQLLTTIHSPSENNPTKIQNEKTALELAGKLKIEKTELKIINSVDVKQRIEISSEPNDSRFELNALLNESDKNQWLAIDKELNEKTREVVRKNVDYFKPKNVNQAAAVVIKLPENEILALVGSPNPSSFESGNQINMLEKPRPIGSTSKPFIYLKAFEKGLRPYTLVEDKEYKYLTALGFPLYPKNFDWQYRGTVNLHYALSNSLNVPAVKVLEYVGLEKFYKFLAEDLGFKPVQPLDNYQLGIALGALEMNLLDLAHYFTIFPNNGTLKELKLFKNDDSENTNFSTIVEKLVYLKSEYQEMYSGKEIADVQYIQLVNKILNDRKTGIEQFGLKSELNLFQGNYALKTGTSRDFRDSWVVGYTPDFLTAVWVGNSDNSPMDKISGQIGAGRIWAEIMELLLNSEYNKKTPFDFILIKEFLSAENLEYGLDNDNYEEILNALKEENLILSPHDGDVFQLEDNAKIMLRAENEVRWFINDEFLGKTRNYIFTPLEPGQYQIKAAGDDGPQEIIYIFVRD